MQLLPVSEVDFDDYIGAFNEAYDGYYVPITLNRDSLSALVSRDAIDLSLSVAAIDRGQVVGGAMLAVREPHGWIGGVGVIPSYRRQGIARQMVSYLLEKARQIHLAEVQLEVIEANVGAYQLYRDLGFKIKRRLLILERLPQSVKRLEGYSITRCDPFDALAYYDEFHDIPNAWQRSREALEDLASMLNGWVVTSSLNPTLVLGYAVGWVGIERINFMDFGIRNDQPNRVEMATALLAYIHYRLPRAVGHIVNIGENDMMASCLQAFGYAEKLAQFEMKLVLDKPNDDL